MLEVEVKLPIADRERLIGRLAANGFSNKETVHETDLYFTSEFHDMLRRDEALRIRTIEDVQSKCTRSVMTFKGAKQDGVSMTRAEYETEVKDAETAVQILKGIGFSPVQKVDKIRTTYVRADISACVDRVDGLGDFLELEILTQDGKREQALAQIEQMLETLGYSMRETTRNSYLSMLLGLEDPA